MSMTPSNKALTSDEWESKIDKATITQIEVPMAEKALRV